MSTFRFENVGHGWVWLVLAAAGFWVLFRTYRGIFQRSERRLTWWLMGLRGAALLAIVLALAKPTWTRATEIVDPGRLAVVLDDSLSMSLPDATGQSRYARALDAVTALRQAVQAPGAADSSSRVEVDLFDVNGAPVAADPPPEPRAERTDLVRAVSQAAARLRSKPLVGVVLVTDGMDNTGRGDLLALADSPAPIYALGFQEDPEAARLDLAVEGVQAPERAIVHNDIKATVLIQKSAGPAIEARVTVRRGIDEMASEEISLPEGEAEEAVDVTFTPSEAGSFVYTAAVSTESGERLLANNARHFPLQVDADPIRVLYLEGFLRHEYKFLRNRLEDDPDVSLVSVVRRADPGRAASAAGELVTPEQLENLDVLILGDMEAGYLSGPEYQAVAEWVDSGHGLLVLGGYGSFGPDGLRNTPLADALPVVFQDEAPFQSEDPFVIELTEAGRRHSVFQISGDRVKDTALWSASPHLLGSSLVKQAKPGAEVLAVNPNFITDQGPAPVAAVQRYGAGHAMVLTIDTTWRWSRLTRVLGQSDTLFARFWSQTVRWLAGRDVQEDRPLIVVSTDRPDYEVGKPVRIEVKRQPQAETDVAAAEVRVTLAREGGAPVPVEVRAGSMDPDRFGGTYYPTDGGRYEVAATLGAAGRPVANQTTEFLVHGSDLELADTRTNRAQLQAIADLTGGLYFDVGDGAALAGAVDRRDRRTPLVQRTELWNSPALFVFFLGAITAEWLIRRRNHLT